MATFNETYETGGSEGMTEEGVLSGFGGVILGGLAGYALSNWNKNGNYGPMVGNVYTQSDVDNIVATKDAQYAQLNATQSSEFNTINRIDTLGINLAQGLSSLGYEQARLANANEITTMTTANTTQGQIADASAKTDLAICALNGKIDGIIPEIKNFYLTDEVAKLRGALGQQQSACGFGQVNTSLEGISDGIKAILAKLYATT